MSYQCMDFRTRVRIKDKVFNDYKEMGLTDREAEAVATYDARSGPGYEAPEHLKMSLEEYVDAWNSAIVNLKAKGDSAVFRSALL